MESERNTALSFESVPSYFGLPMVNQLKASDLPVQATVKLASARELSLVPPGLVSSNTKMAGGFA